MNYNNEFDIMACLNYTLWDVKTGWLIKLDKDKNILAAIEGHTRVVEQQELEKAFGSPPVYSKIDFPKITVMTDPEGDNFWTMSTFFENCKVASCQMGVEMILQKKTDKTYTDLMHSIMRIINRNYMHILPDGTVQKASTYGDYFPAVFKDPTRFIIPQPEMRKVLTKLREQGKFLFLATNSHVEYMELIMTTTLGEDWRTFFDLVTCFCCKPRFFN
jgi:hypothetical protein